ncbi:hypothetical protein BU17DRAFT_65759 [Hysterangium stoloniferum]|nr:hypothetical protein BU17DRAFT_65759 [Hysterangium stoloniferum]
MRAVVRICRVGRSVQSGLSAVLYRPSSKLVPASMPTRTTSSRRAAEVGCFELGHLLCACHDLDEFAGRCMDGINILTKTPGHDVKGGYPEIDNLSLCVANIPTSTDPFGFSALGPVRSAPFCAMPPSYRRLQIYALPVSVVRIVYNGAEGGVSIGFGSIKVISASIVVWRFKKVAKPGEEGGVTLGVRELKYGDVRH